MSRPQPQAGVQILAEFVDAFKANSTMAARDPISGCRFVQLQFKDHEALVSVCEQIAPKLWGLDWIEDPRFAELCAESGLDYSEFFKMESALPSKQLDDWTIKEKGDIGELVAALWLLSGEKTNPALLLMKNAIKLYPRLSVAGVDVMVLNVDPDAAIDAPLGDDEHIIICEAKCGELTSFGELASRAKTSLSQFSQFRWHAELRLALADFRQRGAFDISQRLKYLFFAYFNQPDKVHFEVLLLSGNFNMTIGDIFGEVASIRPIRIVLAKTDVKRLLERTFKFRRADKN